VERALRRLLLLLLLLLLAMRFGRVNADSAAYELNLARVKRGLLWLATCERHVCKLFAVRYEHLQHLPEHAHLLMDHLFIQPPYPSCTPCQNNPMLLQANRQILGKSSYTCPSCPSSICMRRRRSPGATTRTFIVITAAAGTQRRGRRRDSQCPALPLLQMHCGVSKLVAAKWGGLVALARHLHVLRMSRILRAIVVVSACAAAARR
jgi:hypothetical protein